MSGFRFQSGWHSIWLTAGMTPENSKRAVRCGSSKLLTPIARGLYLNREIMQQLAEKYVRTEAQIGLRYLVQQGISVIPKSTQPDRIFANADVFDFELSEADMALIDTMDEQLRSASIPDDLL